MRDSPLYRDSRCRGDRPDPSAKVEDDWLKYVSFNHFSESFSELATGLDILPACYLGSITWNWDCFVLRLQSNIMAWLYILPTLAPQKHDIRQALLGNMRIWRWISPPETEQHRSQEIILFFLFKALIILLWATTGNRSTINKTRFRYESSGSGFHMLMMHCKACMCCRYKRAFCHFVFETFCRYHWTCNSCCTQISSKIKSAVHYPNSVTW